MYWFIVIVIIVVVYLSYKYGQSTCEKNQLLGFWESPPEFNKESAIDMCTFYIGEKENGKYPAYILMVDDEDVLINEPCEFTLSESIFYNSDVASCENCREFQMTLSEFESDFWPSKMRMRYYPYTNKIILNDDKKIYMVLYKNPILTELEQIKKDRKKNPPAKFTPSTKITQADNPSTEQLNNPTDDQETTQENTQATNPTDVG